jgi:hypothetical protein
MNGEKRNTHRLLLGKPEGKRPKCRWVDNFNMDPVQLDGVVWTGLIWLRTGTSGELL